VIARFWWAQSLPSQVPAYTDHLNTHVLPALRNVPGYAGAMLLEREATGEVEILVITFWQSLDSIRAFAGDNLENAVVMEEAAILLSRFDQRVKHYRLLIQDEITEKWKPDR